MTARLSLIRPDDWHVHLRDDAMLRAVAPVTAAHFGRAIVMPNLVPPVTSVAAAVAYRDRILAALPAGHRFTPLMTCYLTETVAADEIAAGFADGVFAAVKLYPAGATTNAQFGVRDIAHVRPVLERMQAIDMPLLIHGEVVDPEVDIFDREARFIERVLIPLRRDFPELRVVSEHVTTAEAVAYVQSCDPAFQGATITPQHLMLNRNALFQGGLRPHHYCLPVLKRERHRLALRAAATSGDPRFFLGTDSAPHAVGAKEADCGCAGVFNAPTALACYAQVFDEEGALDRLEAFASLNGPRFYKLPVNAGRVVLEKRDDPEGGGDPVLPVEGRMDGVRIFQAEAALPWRVVEA